MSTIMSLVKRAPRRFSALLAIAVAAIVVPVAVQAWGPNRATFTIEKPANYVTFNSITNNPNIGDERNFVGIRESGTNNLWSDNQAVQNGKEYTVRMYVHNNAAANLNLVAENVTAKFNLPTTTAKSIQVNGFVSASNANPGEVYDHATMTSDKDFNLAVVPGSIIYENNKGTHALPESIFTSAGAKLGYESMNGRIPGCFEYAGYVSFKVKPQFAPEPPTNFTVSKQVKKADATKFEESIEAKSGDLLKYRITVANTGQTQLNNVNLKDRLPAGISYVPGTVKIMNANNPGGAPIANGDTLFSASGVNIGHYTGGGSNAIIAFDAKVEANDKLPVCGPNKLTNVAVAQPEGQGPKEDGADVVVPKECLPVVKYTCDALTVQRISNTEFKFSTAYTVENATFKSVTYVVKDAAGKEIYRGANANYTQTTPGAYSVQAFVTVTVNGEDKTVTSEGCAKTFEVPKTETPVIDVCELSTKKIITIKEADFDGSKHSKNLEDCKEVPPVTPPTTTPPELPQTGAADGILGAISLGALVASITYYAASRRLIGAN